MKFRSERNLLIPLLFSSLCAEIKDRVQTNELAIIWSSSSVKMKLATWTGGVGVQLEGAGLERVLRVRKDPKVTHE